MLTVTNEFEHLAEDQLWLVVETEEMGQIQIGPFQKRDGPEVDILHEGESKTITDVPLKGRVLSWLDMERDVAPEP